MFENKTICPYRLRKKGTKENVKKYRISQNHSQTRCTLTMARQNRRDCWQNNGKLGTMKTQVIRLRSSAIISNNDSFPLHLSVFTIESCDSR